MKKLKIGLIQMMCEKGEMAGNLKRMGKYLDEAEALDVEIIAFPEMSITGYADPTRDPNAILRLDGDEVATLRAMTAGRSFTVLAGLIEENPQGKPFITQIVVRDGEMIGYYRKRTIEDEELEWFSPGQDVPIFTHNELTFGLAICADIGYPDVFASCAAQGADIVFELAAPGLYGAQATRDWATGYAWWEGDCRKKLGRYAQELGVWIAVATQAGRTLDEDFPGGGFVFAPDGQRRFSTRDWQPGAVYLTLDLDEGTVRRISAGFTGAGRIWQIKPTA